MGGQRVLYDTSERTKIKKDDITFAPHYRNVIVVCDELECASNIALAATLIDLIVPVDLRCL